MFRVLSDNVVSAADEELFQLAARGSNKGIKLKNAIIVKNVTILGVIWF